MCIYRGYGCESVQYERMAKRKYNEMEVSDMSQSNSATVHGVFIGAVSPTRESRTKPEIKFFESLLSDGKETVRVVSFEPKLRAEVEQARESGDEVAVTNCCVKKSRKPGCEGLEVVAGSRTTVVRSPKKFKINEGVRSTAASVCGPKDIRTLEEIKDLAEGQHVNVTGKIQSIEPPESVYIKSRGRP